jgi:hypothetical protein
MSDDNYLRKLEGGCQPDGNISEVTRFKSLWRENLTDVQKAEFFTWFNELGTTVAMIRQRIEERYQIKLQYDAQVTGKWGLKKWCAREQDKAEVAKRAAIEEATLRDAHPNWGLNELREELLLRMKRRALAEDDFILGLQLFKVDSRDAKLKLERERFVDSTKCPFDRGLECCLKEAEKNPALVELFKHAFDELRKAHTA